MTNDFYCDEDGKNVSLQRSPSNYNRQSTKIKSRYSLFVCLFVSYHWKKGKTIIRVSASVCGGQRNERIANIEREMRRVEFIIRIIIYITVVVFIHSSGGGRGLDLAIVWRVFV